MRLVPQGVIARDTNIGVRLTPKGPPANPLVCVSNWDAWAVTVDAVPQSGDLHIMQNATTDPIVIHVALLGTLCPGACIAWETRPLLDDGGILIGVGQETLAPNGCDAVDITLAHTVLTRYEGLWFGLYATIDGEPFGETIIFTTDTPSMCTEPGFIGPWESATNGPTPPLSNDGGGSYVSPYETTFPNSAFTMDFVPTGQGPTDFCALDDFHGRFISQSGGDPAAYGDFSLVPASSVGGAGGGLRLIATGDHDYAGISLSIFAISRSPIADYGDTIDVACIDP